MKWSSLIHKRKHWYCLCTPIRSDNSCKLHCLSKIKAGMKCRACSHYWSSSNTSLHSQKSKCRYCCSNNIQNCKKNKQKLRLNNSRTQLNNSFNNSRFPIKIRISFLLQFHSRKSNTPLFSPKEYTARNLKDISNNLNSGESKSSSMSLQPPYLSWRSRHSRR